MEMRKIGSLSVSAVGLGCNNFGWALGEELSRGVIDAAIDAGVTFFDTADVYGETASESFLGNALGSRRREVVLATKFGSKLSNELGGASAGYVRSAAEASLRRLKTDYIDLFQLHRPDPRVPIAEIGCSNFSVAQMREAAEAVKPGAARFVSVQNEYSLFERAPERDGVLAECESEGVAFLPYFPLANGLLTGKYREGVAAPAGTRIGGPTGFLNFAHLLTDENLATVECLNAFAEARGHTLLELAFAWLLAHEPVASVIAGATKPEQVAANARAAGWKLTPDDLQALDRVLASTAAAEA
jgi:aryl-alcohol dehydrogenase-like predicted oxidoreductase